MPGRLLAQCLPKPPRTWSLKAVTVLTPVLIAIGLFCTIMTMRMAYSDIGPVSAEVALAVSFPFVMMVGGIMLIVSGPHDPDAPKPIVLALGVATAFAYVMLWMFNGKRSPSLIGALSGICAFYIARQKRPSWPVLLATAFIGRDDRLGGDHLAVQSRPLRPHGVGIHPVRLGIRRLPDS